MNAALLLFLFGAAGVIAGICMIYIPAGAIAAGLLLIALAMYFALSVKTK